MNKKLGFVGLGKMGGAMAERLLSSGYVVYVHDIDSDRVKELERFGGRRVSSLEELAAQSEVVLTSLPDPVTVKRVYFGDNGLLSQLDEGKYVIELSTIDAETMKQIAFEGKRKGIRVIDAPASGGPPEARAGKLVMLVGADDSEFAACHDILRTLGEHVHLVGSPGSGKAIKLVNNLITLGNVLVAGEAFLLGVQAGIEPKRLYEVLSQCAGRSHQFIKRFPKWIERDFAPGYSIDLGAKDLKLLLDMANEMKRSVPLANDIFKYYEKAKEDGLGHLDILAVTKEIEKIASNTREVGQ